MECVCSDSRPLHRSISGRLKGNFVRNRVYFKKIVVPEVKSFGQEVCVYSLQKQRPGDRVDSHLGQRIHRLDGTELRVDGRRDRWNWKHHPKVMTAAVVFSLSISLPSSSPLALEMDRVSQAQVQVVEAVVRELQVDGPKQLVAINAPEVSKVVQAVGSTMSKPKAVPVIHPVVLSSGSRLLARIMQHFGGGGIAGAIGAALVYPLDTVKTRMQAQSSKDGDQCKYKNEIDCFRKLVTDEGLGSLYSGLLPQLVGIAPEKAMKLTVNELLLEMLEHVMPGAGLWFLELIAGSGGGFSQVVFTNPMEIVKVRLQTQTTSNKRGLREVISELGFRGLYHGAGVTLARDIPSSGIFFACYALLRQLYPDQGFADGFLAAIPATVLSTPMDVVKTRLQMELPDGQVPHENALACLKSVWQAEGPGALFKGSLARVLRTSPQFGVTLVVYNFICGSGS